MRAHLEAEAAAGLNRFDFYRGFGDRVVALQESLREMLERFRKQGKRIAAYGAAAKGTVLLNAVGHRGGPDRVRCRQESTQAGQADARCADPDRSA